MMVKISGFLPRRYVGQEKILSANSAIDVTEMLIK